MKINKQNLNTKQQTQFSLKKNSQTQDSVMLFQDVPSFQ